MELVITLPEEVQVALEQRAHERGCEDVTNYVERLIRHDLFAAKTKQVIAESPQKTNEALAAVHRLTNLFADAEITHLDQILLDPMLELANDKDFERVPGIAVRYPE
jgi:hypothetical protein